MMFAAPQPAVPADVPGPDAGWSEPFLAFCTTPDTRHGPGARSRFPEAEVAAWVTAPGFRCPVWIRPPADPERGHVLLIHGWGGSAEVMAGFLKPLAALGHGVVALDLPGHGLAQGPGLCTAVWSGLATQAAARLVPHVTGLIAHSFGASVGAYLAHAPWPFAGPVLAPKARLMLLASPDRLGSMVGRWQRRADRQDAVHDAIDADVTRLAGRPLAAFNVGEMLARAGHPTLLMHAEDDVDLPITEAEAVAAAAGDVVTFERMPPGPGHQRILMTGSVLRRASGWFA